MVNEKIENLMTGCTKDMLEMALIPQIESDAQKFPNLGLFLLNKKFILHSICSKLWPFL